MTNQPDHDKVCNVCNYGANDDEWLIVDKGVVYCPGCSFTEDGFRGWFASQAIRHKRQRAKAAEERRELDELANNDEEI